MDRPDISRLNKNRSIFLKVGFIISLGLTAMAFNYTVYDDFNEDYQVKREIQADELQEVQRTVHKEKRQPPPPVLKPTKDYIEEEVIFDPDPLPEPKPIKSKVVVTMEPIQPTVKATPAPKPIILPEEPEEDIKELFEIVEQMPRFPGCEEASLNEKELKTCADRELLNFINSRIKYPPLARENGIQGTVVVSFVVEKDGSITGLKMLRDIGGGCGKEVNRIVKQMPNWIPGEQRKRKVRVQFNLPVKFSLQ